MKSVQFSFDLLPLFFGKSAWKTDRETESFIKDSIESKTHNIDCLEATLTEKYRSPDQSEITPENGLVITLRTHPYFELQYSEKKSIIKIQQDIFKIRNLLSIICGEALTVSYASYRFSERESPSSLDMG